MFLEFGFVSIGSASGLITYNQSTQMHSPDGASGTWARLSGTLNKRGLQFIEAQNVRVQSITPKKSEISGIAIPLKSLPPNERHVGSSSNSKENTVTPDDDDDFDNVLLRKTYCYHTPCPSVGLHKAPSSSTGKLQLKTKIDKHVNAP